MTMPGPVPFVALLVPPLLAALAAPAGRAYPRTITGLHALLALAPVAAAGWLAALVVGGAVPTWGPGALFRVDALSALLAVCVAAVSALAVVLGPGFRHAPPGEARRFRLFASLFAFTMLVAVTTDNVALMWVAIEATTITSAVLVPLHRSRASVEASWKYILIGSVGIALAFVGTVLAYFDFVTLAGESPAALHWTVLMAAAPRMHPAVVELAFVFLLVGYGTKAGIAPMHTWLPDAHAEAPAALSAMMSGVLLAVALYAIVRWKAVVSVAGHGAFADRLLIGLGLLSLGLAALSLVGQRHYKRLLAYSSIEHTGLLCVGLALGPLGTFAAMLHLINHSAAKSMMFLLSGRILERYGTGDLRQVSGLLRAMPITGGLFAAGMLALIGLPPFGIFISKLALLRAGFATGHAWLMAIVLAFLAVAFIALIGHLNRMLNGAPPAGVTIGEGGRWPLVPLALCALVLALLGVVLPAPVETLLDRIVEITTP